MTHFRYCETFSNFFLGPPPRGLIMTGAASLPYVGTPYRLGSLRLTLPHKFYTHGYCFDLMQCDRLLRHSSKVGYSLVMYWDWLQFVKVLG